jgi:8-hydroxy-5-deazaflavin:NADPH oxidoreductase
LQTENDLLIQVNEISYLISMEGGGLLWYFCIINNNMPLPKTIAIIGATGDTGAAIAKALAVTPDRLLLFGKSAEKLGVLFHDIKITHPASDIDIIECAKEACWEADIIIAAVSYDTASELADKIRSVSTGKIVISIADPLNTRYDCNTPAASPAEELQELLPRSKVITVYNATFAADFLNPLVNGLKADVFVAGNDEQSMETVAELLRSGGFNPIITGGLREITPLENILNNYNKN